MKKYTVTWPTRPSGVYSELVWADDPTDAVRVAAELDWPTAPGYTIAFDYTPMVWRLQRPYRWRSRRVAGSDFPDVIPGRVAFTPEPFDLREVANQAMGAVKVGDALGHGEDEIRMTVGQILGLLTPAEAAGALAIVAAEVRESDAYTSGEGPEETAVVASNMPMEPDYYLGWAALSVNEMAEMERNGIKPTDDDLKAHRLYIDTAHRAGVTDEQIHEFARVTLGGRSR